MSDKNPKSLVTTEVGISRREIIVSQTASVAGIQGVRNFSRKCCTSTIIDM